MCLLGQAAYCPKGFDDVQQAISFAVSTLLQYKTSIKSSTKLEDLLAERMATIFFLPLIAGPHVPSHVRSHAFIVYANS